MAGAAPIKQALTLMLTVYVSQQPTEIYHLVPMRRYTTRITIYNIPGRGSIPFDLMRSEELHNILLQTCAGQRRILSRCKTQLTRNYLQIFINESKTCKHEHTYCRAGTWRRRGGAKTNQRLLRR